MKNENRKIDKLNAISNAIVQLRLSEIVDLTKGALKDGISALDVLNQGLVSGMTKVGNEFKNGEIFLPELLLSAKIMKEALRILLPILSKNEEGFVGRVAIGTVKGDIHDLGKNIVISILQGNGFEVIDVGIDVDPQKFVEVVRNNDIQILGLSALLTSTMPMLNETIKALENANLRQKVKVLVGGAPLTQKYADKIGADGYAEDAVEAAEKAKALVLNKSI